MASHEDPTIEDRWARFPTVYPSMKNFELGLQRAHDIRMAQQMIQWLPRTRLCQLCAKRYTETPARALFDNLPPRCPDCMTVLDRIAVEMRTKIGLPVTREMVAGLMGQRTPYRPFQYGRPWKDHVPNHSKHLIKETTPWHKE